MIATNVSIPAATDIHVITSPFAMVTPLLVMKNFVDKRLPYGLARLRDMFGFE
jgi:hypothetical protein